MSKELYNPNDYRWKAQQPSDWTHQQWMTVRKKWAKYCRDTILYATKD